MQMAKIPASEGNQVWDSSNIAESYSGIVLPMTCSFAVQIYSIAYKNVALASGVSQRKVKEYEPIFQNLLGFFYGRVYYNMLNWYRMLTLFPGFRRNKENLDLMISAMSKAELDEAHSKNVSMLFRIKYYSHLFVRVLFFGHTLRRFKSDVRAILGQYRKKQLHNMPAHELMAAYDKFTSELLSRWSTTIDNDFLVMNYYGAMRGLCRRENIPDHKVLDMVSNITDIISAKQVQCLAAISKSMAENPEILSIASSGKYAEALGIIMAKEKYTSIRAEIDDYLGKYGGRFANELRLEAPDLDSDPEYLIRLLVLYSGKAWEKKANADSGIPRITFPKSILLRYLLKNTRKHIRHREELRLLRSQAFSHVRKMLVELGKRLSEAQVIGEWHDIFYLEIDEVRRFIAGSSISMDLTGIIAHRKEDYSKFENINPESHFQTTGIPGVFLSNLNQNTKYEKIGKLNGQGCSPGIITGKVKIMEKFELPENNS